MIDATSKVCLHYCVTGLIKHRCRSSQSRALLASLGKETFRIKPRMIVTGTTGRTVSVVDGELLKAGYLVLAIVRRDDGTERS